ncbi:hypothetical protein LWI29_030262 [Acer saccharum]|uniref:Plant PDR ABC transporter associated domain-containing protein n=1 Tax=Acer saccharum TaxID=4024 RepID=A0AA39SXC2_ACESA|nr:hypothetical protein LWI29_030262 [Acer saccharum]
MISEEEANEQSNQGGTKRKADSKTISTGANNTGYGYLDIEANVTIEIVQSNWFGSKSNSSLVVMGPSDFTSIIWFQCSEKEWIGVAALLGFTVLFNVLLYINPLGKP